MEARKIKHIDCGARASLYSYNISTLKSSGASAAVYSCTPPRLNYRTGFLRLGVALHNYLAKQFGS